MEASGVPEDLGVLAFQAISQGLKGEVKLPTCEVIVDGQKESHSPDSLFDNPLSEIKAETE